MITQNYIAIDIAKESLAVAADSFSGSFTYDSRGLNKLVKHIDGIDQPLVVCEATGGYERVLMSLLFSRQIPVALVNPARVRAFAKSEGTKAKTDPIDAKVLLRFAVSKELQPTPPPSSQVQQLQALMDRRSQLTETLAREKNRLQKSPQCTLESIGKVIEFIEHELEHIELQIRAVIDSDQTMHLHSSIMQQVTGVGETTAWTILAYLGELTSLNRNQLVALAGIAPYNRDSGKYKGKRRIEGGRAKVRKCLYMAAQSAAVHNPHIKAYVDRLRKKGKPYKWAMVAAMRKILLHLRSLLKNQQLQLA
ncbi:IS110 family transposase [Coraliomargarita akajimensis]|uniref:Transposase IS111A/IS1328/IS1533 n=1 Tax=Coraliomargarita akajimensis (strain DSM 45221 / IAM 15411 / JCM 23193 / KCTC 12865 / 04OKA010-24) TaxID=583355 RepID=D5ER16_CORAD|nr:IS110 family transposase [Coraliomargarita akajimensis]ADE54009.1 transposase IS111A/IS1328/IS1533 [Coraliomargarita akajimensis DSM 45221]ADE54013.1 transposase IS111A/IS1328/IS1533 [Coraliomargarita akajimensis DSM 45221]ADE55923.1 transposase IS111A/IS1328/IS1533 [Coraliomargarita akajimensis DSM 45221]ADE55952.1 transposase IS111A/IS1328/IS1533 [Coraliomargarita akajimensis DSM 45221]